MKNIVSTLNLQLINGPTTGTVKVNFNFHLEGKKLVKETKTYISNVKYYPGFCTPVIDTDEGTVYLLSSYRTGKVFHCTNQIIGQAKTEYKDTGDIQYTLIYGEYIIRGGTTEEVYVYLIKESKVTLRVRSCGKMSLVSNNKLITDTKHLKKFLALMCDRFNLNLSVVDYYLSRSPKIRSTNWETDLMSFYYLYTFGKPKATVYRKVANNDIKGATAALLWHPQASKAVVRKIKGLFDIGAYSTSNKLRVARDKISTIKLRDIQGFNNFSLALLNNFDNIRNLGLIAYLGAVFPKVCKSILANKDYSLAEDTVRAYRLLEPNDIYAQDYDITSLRELHDVLTQRLAELEDREIGLCRLPTLNELRRLPTLNELRRLPTLNELPVSFKNGYTVKSVNAHDLPSLGKAMSICVGMYKQQCWLGAVNISAVYDPNGKPVACLEWYYGECGKGYLVQAKLFANKSVCMDETILDLVLEWSKLNNILVNTRDMGGTYEGSGCFLPPRPKPLEERQTLLRSNASQVSCGYMPL